ncbi:Glutamate-ammonia-ligase adenylyltransferase [Enhygromyxa salina]|uniref:Glutamate-ammonia-ligase adenylyltransferase n=1 Tax=Enhygromyxa salina TaxID=215803 RepID=A0A0C1ZPE8_9BACT|nr:glutamine-synthetase adenylyltransferase [Enhygromyxa salina]KIG12888.1 Glutamate-ammonia-ligase adenylyltransferase [Enhygromyxa salina]
MSAPLDDLGAILEHALALEARERDAFVNALAPRWRTPLQQLLAGPEPDAAIQRALTLPTTHLREPPSSTFVALLHQGSYPTRLMRLLDAPLVHALLVPNAPRQPSVSEQIEAALAEHPVAEAIARVRTRNYLWLARRELEHAPLEEVGRALSDVAGACIDAALRGVDPQLAEQVCVFGMGKLGGRELNFLSDIDLVFVHTDEAVAAPDEARAHRLRTALHDRLRKALRLIEGSGVWRPLFHVDLRLRPFGSRGPLSLSLSALERYYERHGRGWERQAWLRARPVAGNLELGATVLDRLSPFVWRRSLGPEIFDEIAAMMKRSRAQAHDSIGSANVDLKHDAGGIREVEFFVQSLQLLNGGRNPSVRARSTLDACDRLAAAGLLSDREHEILARAYRVLRRIEHRVQLSEGQQTHRVPQVEPARELLARRLAVGAPPTWLIGAVRNLAGALEPAPPRTLTSFDAALTELRGQVQAITGTLTGESELAGQAPAERGVAQAVLLDPGSSPRSRLEALAIFGLWPEAAEEVAAMLDHLLSRPHGALASSGAALAGGQRLLLACLDSANPVEAVRRFVEFSATRPAHLAMWRVMGAPEQEQLVRQIADLFGASEPLSRGLIGFGGTSGPARDGGLSLLLEAAASELPTADELRERFANFHAEGEDTSLDHRLMLFKHRELVRIGIYDLGRRPDPLAVGRSLSDLADLVVRELLADLAAEQRDGPAFTLAVLTLGKFGMQAMDYGSDLDLMFVFEPADSVSPTVARESAQRVSRRLIARLEDRSRGLRLYEVDMRMRPSGRQGLLVSSLTGFRSYHSHPLEVWERLALVRLRGVAEQQFPSRGAAHAPNGVEADPSTGLAATIVNEIVPASVWARDDDPDHVASETRRLKERIELELARETREQWNIKTGVGGVLEAELLVSALQLRHDVHAQAPPTGQPTSPARMNLRARDIPSALQQLASIGALDPAEALALDRAYRFERRLLNRLRMSRGSDWGETDRLTLNSPRLTALARRMGLADRDTLVSTLERERSLIRAAFDRHLPRLDPPDTTRRPDDTHAGDH